MIRIFRVDKKDGPEIVAVADHQKDLNNLRLMSYNLLGKDKVMLVKSDFGGPYIKLKCEEFKTENGEYDLQAVDKRVRELQGLYN